MAEKVSVDGLADAVLDALRNYSKNVTDTMKNCVLSAAETCLQEIQEKSPVQTGGYKQGWQNKVAYENGTGVRVVIYNEDNYQLTHLLEFGHANVNGGRTPCSPSYPPSRTESGGKAREKSQ